MKHKTTIVIPVYNEGDNICSALSTIRRDVQGDYVVAVVYDFDEDTTLPALDRWEKENGKPVLRIRNKYGRGALNAIRTGLETADSEYVVVTMADLSDPPSVINDMVRKADEEKADIVCGSRYMRGGKQTGGPFLKGLMSRSAGLSLHLLAGLPTHDPTNSFKLYRKSFLDKMTIESTGGFELGLELVVKGWQRGYKVTEVPTSWADRVEGKSNFKLWKWLPHYLYWYFSAMFGDAEQRDRGLLRAGGVVLFLLFLLLHIPDPCPQLAALLQGGLDPSWIRILFYAHQQGLQFGQDVIFTYGPLGYLLFPIAPTILFPSILLSFALLLPFGVVFFRKKSFADLAFLAVFTVVSICYCSAYDVFVFLFPMLIWNILEKERPWIRYGGIVYCAIMGAFCVMIKFMCAPVIVFSLLVADALLLKRKRIVLALPTFLVFVPLIWCFPAGQTLSNLGSFFLYSWHIAIGYGYAMTCGNESPWWILLSIYGAAVVFSLVVFASGKNGSCRSIFDRICYILLPASVLFVVCKYGIGRLDGPHIVLSMCYLVLIATFCCTDPGIEPRWRWALFVFFVLLMGGVMIAFSESFSYLYLYLDLYAKIVLSVLLAVLLICVLRKYAPDDRLCRYCRLLFLPVFILWTLCDLFVPRINQLDDFFTKYPKLVLLSAGEVSPSAPTADCFAHEIRVLFKSKMRYSPRLVFQSYSAYTPLLLRKNAEHFEYDAGPDCLFYGWQELDDILPSAFDTLALRQIMINYEPVPGKKMLRKKKQRPPAMRLREVKTIRTKFKRRFVVPQDQKPMFMSIDLHGTLLGSVLKRVIRPAAITMKIVLYDNRRFTHKLIPENCGVPFLISPYLHSWSELGDLLDTKERKLTNSVIISLHPVFYLDSEYWDRRIGKLFFRKEITVRFYRLEPVSEKQTEK
ncbi:MAG: glycosyltransferase [Lentisphaeria bacterium]|nr:glycosyltransferase [Lentisphaeria bacterium]